MAKPLVIWLPVILLAAILVAPPASAQSDEFAMANKFYEDKDFGSAIRLYHSILDRGKESATLHFNLANAYFKSGDLGHAILYYTRAQRLAPADEDIAFNLDFAKQFSRVQMEGVQLNPIRTFFETLVRPYQLQQLGWITSVLLFILLGALTVRISLGHGTSWLRIITAVSLVILVAVGSLTTFKYRHDFLTPRAVIISEESPVYTGASEQSEIELNGAPGLVVEILSESDGFLNVLFENKRRGWIKTDLVARI